MKGFKSHFVFSKNQQNGIFVLVLVIVILQGAYFVMNNSNTEPAFAAEDEDIKKIQKQIDSIKIAKTEADTFKIFPFNPNYLTDYRGYTLGMTTAEIDRLLEFRKEDQWINSAEDFKRVTGVSDSLLNTISPYFKFPEWVQEQQLSTRKSVAAKPFSAKSDLNKAKAEDLQKVNGIGEVLSTRIINYRNKIGGFIDDIQLKDIYGLNYETRDKLTAEFTVKEKPDVEIIDINEAELLELSEIPYIGYELAREIIDYRLLNEKIDNFEELTKIDDFPSDKIDRIQLYLSID